MSIEKVRDFFGIRYLIPYNITTKKPYVVLRAVGEVSYENAIDAIELLGGHVEAPHDVEYGQPSPTLTGTVREYPSALFQILETSTITENAAESGGYDSSPTNHQGTSIIKGTNGITGVTINPSEKSNLMFGEYVLVATDTNKVNIHVNGLGESYLSMDGVVAEDVTCSAGTVDVDELGITITVNGTPAFVTGDTASLEIRPENTGSSEILVGAGTVPSNFGVRCIFPKKTDGVMHFIDVFNVSGRGMPWKGVSREFSEFEINWKPMARSSDGAVYQLVRCLGV